MKKYFWLIFAFAVSCNTYRTIEGNFTYNQTFTAASGNSVINRFNYYTDRDILFTGHDNNSLFFEIRQEIIPENSKNEKTISKTSITVQKSDLDSSINVNGFKFKVLSVKGGVLTYTLLNEPKNLKDQRLSNEYGFKSELYKEDGALLIKGKIVDENETTFFVSSDIYTPGSPFLKKEIHHIIKIN